VTTASVADGRTARSTKTRDSIADALLDLLAEGDLRPTAKTIAERAGVSVRSVYVHFDDLEDLFCVAAQRQFGRLAPTDPASDDGPLRQRAEAVVARRAAIYAELGAVMRATQLNAPFSDTLTRLMREAAARSRKELERVFAAELERVPAEDRVAVLATLDALSSPASWDVLRDLYDLPDADAQRAIVETIVARLRPEAA
jgi:TetR/AcrR family transcriptional regulator, regulator of autoinduction and epiphytic fitness